MTKIDFIKTITPILREKRYKKDRTYWYKEVDNHLCCINVEGSQWDKNNYYINIGFYFPVNDCKTPKLLQWTCRHRCEGVNGELNIPLNEFLAIIDDLFGEITETSQIQYYMEQCNAQVIINQLWF